MKQKILFFDIDGTLIDEETDVVPESAKKALAAAKEKGHLLFICSGRCLAIIPQNVVDLGFDGLIGGCGTYIEMEGKEVYHHTLPMELQKEIIKDLEKYHIDGVLEGKDCSAFRRDYWMPKVVSIFTENGSFTARTQCYWDEEFSFDKMALWFDESSDMAAFRKKYETQFDFIERDPTFYEVIPKGISKATGIRKVCEMIDIPHEDTFAFGDSANDLEMLAYVAHSIAMGNGTDKVKNTAEFVTRSVDEDGILHGLKHYGLI